MRPEPASVAGRAFFLATLDLPSLVGRQQVTHAGLRVLDGRRCVLVASFSHIDPLGMEAAAGGQPLRDGEHVRRHVRTMNVGTEAQVSVERPAARTVERRAERRGQEEEVRRDAFGKVPRCDLARRSRLAAHWRRELG